MSSASDSTKGAMPPDTGLRVGIATVDSNNAVTVEVSGQPISCGYLDPRGGVVTGSPVAIMRGEASWLVLGAIGTQPAFTPSVNLAASTGTLVLTTAQQAVPGATITVTVAAGQIWSLHAVFDFNVTVAAATVAVGIPTLDGGQVGTGGALYSNQTSIGRGTVSTIAKGTFSTAGSHTFGLVASKTANLGTVQCVTDNTILMVRVEG